MLHGNISRENITDSSKFFKSVGDYNSRLHIVLILDGNSEIVAYGAISII